MAERSIGHRGLRRFSWAPVLLLAAVAACQGGESGTDLGVRRDAMTGVRLDSGAGIDAAAPADAVGMQPDAEPEDAPPEGGEVGGADVRDAGIADAPARDAAPTDAADSGSSDRGPQDRGGLDSTPRDALPDASPDAQPVPEAGVDAGYSQTGEVVVTEYRAGSTVEWFELYNPGTTAVELTTLSVRIGSSAVGSQPIRAASDPTGSLHSMVPLSPGAFMYGVPNPTDASAIPPGARFVFGTPGVYGARVFQPTGDVLVISHGAPNVDVVDFTRSVSDPTAVLGPADFPLSADDSTQLDPSSYSATANDNASNWCAPIGGATPGAPNLNCGAVVINELTYHFASIANPNDPQSQFIELFGPPGGRLANTLIARLYGGGPRPGDIAGEIRLSGTRLPMSGYYLLASDNGTGTTHIAGANQVANLQLSDPPGAIQLVRTGTRTVLLDSFGWGTLPGGLTDAVRGLAAYQGTPVAGISAVAHPANWTRARGAPNRHDNRLDFHYDPSPTPGRPAGTDTFGVMRLDPNNALASRTTTISVLGTQFTDQMIVTIGGQTATCTAIEANTLHCVVRYPTGGPGTAQRVDVVVSAHPLLMQQVTLPAGFTWTTAANFTRMNECNYCVLQFPSSFTVAAGTPSPEIYGRIYQMNLTDQPPVPAPGISAELGYGPAATNPMTSSSWSWRPTVFNVRTGPTGHDDEYMQTLTFAQPGTYLYTYRFSLDGGLTWTYVDRHGSGTNPGLGFDPTMLGTATVQ